MLGDRDVPGVCSVGPGARRPLTREGLFPGAKAGEKFDKEGLSSFGRRLSHRWARAGWKDHSFAQEAASFW